MAHQAYEYDPYYLHHYHHQGAPPPQDYSGGGGGFTDWNISTLFVAGLPDDVKPREIHNLFRRRPGFDYCQLKYTGRGNQVVAFVTFLNHQSALAALHSLNGVKFDPQAGSVLHIELARSNSTRKRKPGTGAYVVIDRRNRKAADAQETSSDDGDNESDDPSGNNNPNPGDNDDIAAGKSSAARNPENAVNGQKEKNAEGGACSTLFIANLGPTCTQDELKQVLSQYPGFNVLKMRARGGMPVAFADFEEVEQATRVMNELQGNLLASSDRGGMHLEYARSKMRKS